MKNKTVSKWRILVLTIMIFGFTLFQSMGTDAEAGIIVGVSRAGCGIGAMESITWDQQMGVVKRWMWSDSYHFNYENGWKQKHLARSGWIYGWTTGTAGGHYGEYFSYPAVVGTHHTYFLDGRGYRYLGRTQAINTCDGQPSWLGN